MSVQVPVYRNGALHCYAVVDDDDGAMAGLRWHLSSKGYVRRIIRNGAGGMRTIYLHRMVLGVTAGNQTVDHLDGDKLNNRRANREAVTVHENTRRQMERQSKNGGLTMARRWRERRASTPAAPPVPAPTPREEKPEEPPSPF